jgi:hypothetical protein
MKRHQLKANLIISGPIFSEPVQVLMTQDMGDLVKVIGKGLRTDKVYEPVLDTQQLETITASPDREPFDGDPVRFRLGVEAMRLGLATPGIGSKSGHLFPRLPRREIASRLHHDRYAGIPVGRIALCYD